MSGVRCAFVFETFVLMVNYILYVLIYEVRL